MQLMAFGMFVFSLQTLAYQELQRQTAWRHGSTSRIGVLPARQFLGPGDDKITLPGVLYPGQIGDIKSLDTLRYMGDSGKAYALVDGTGQVFGAWILEDMSETRRLFFADGVPRQIEFSLSLTRVDENRVDLLGNLADQADQGASA